MTVGLGLTSESLHWKGKVMLLSPCCVEGVELVSFLGVGMRNSKVEVTGGWSKHPKIVPSISHLTVLFVERRLTLCPILYVIVCFVRVLTCEGQETGGWEIEIY